MLENVHIAVRVPRLDRSAQDFHLMAVRFFDQFRHSLSHHLTAPLNIATVELGSETFAQFCERTRAQFVFVIALDSSATVAFRTKAPMPRLIMNALFNAGDKKPSGSEGEAYLSPIEARIFVQMISSALTTAVERVVGARLEGVRQVEVIQNVDQADLLAQAFGADEPMSTAQARTMLRGQSGDCVIGVPLSLMSQLGSTKAPAPLDSSPGLGCLHDFRNVTGIPIEMAAVLGEREMSLGEVRRLKPGAVVFFQRLHHFPRAELRAGGQTLFHGTIVESHGWHNFLIQQLGSPDVERTSD
jgi:flagellar motor switch protein FliM